MELWIFNWASPELHYSHIKSSHYLIIIIYLNITYMRSNLNLKLKRVVHVIIT